MRIPWLSVLILACAAPAVADTLPVLDISIDVEVRGVLARTEIVQSFRNDSDTSIEAHYVFPLPERAAVREMEMRIGDRTVRSIVQERAEARRTFEAARDAGRKAALLAQNRPNLFSIAVTHIGAGETIDVRLVYLEELPHEDGAFTLRVPLTHTPRFVPAGGEAAIRPAALPSSGSPRLGGVPTVRLGVTIHEPPGIADLASPTHAIRAEVTPSGRRVEPRDGPLRADRDLVLRWGLARTDASTATLLVEEDPRGERHAMLVVVPPEPETAATLALPTETLFVIDVSGSMKGPSIRQARAALLAALDRLRPEDRFGVLAFSDRTILFGEGLHSADDDSLAQGRQFVSRLEAGGGTEIHPALIEALDILASSRGSNAQRIVFLTDGAVSNEDRVLRTIVERLGDARLHAIGIGAAPNGWLMRKMTRHGRGLCAFVSTVDEASNRIDRFFERLDLPVLSGIELRTEGLALEEVEPDVLPDLHAGEPLVVYGRIERLDDAATATLGGWTRDGWRETPVRISPRATETGAIAARWARARVGAWMDRAHEGTDAALVRERIVELGLAHGLVTQFTSLVALDDRPTAMDTPRPAVFAGTLPRGGTSRPLGRLIGAFLTALGLALVALGRTR